jgi:quinoprotein glucose dehydrogenase
LKNVKRYVLSGLLMTVTFGIGCEGPVHGSRSAQAGSAQEKESTTSWEYGGGPAQDHYSPLTQINRSNVSRLQVAWTYDTEEKKNQEAYGLETTPLIIDGVLYGLTPTQQVFALNAATGKLLWKFSSGIYATQADRGLAYWADGSDKRVFAGNMNFVYALNAETGKPIPAFGDGGRIDLRENLGRDPSSVSIELTSPPIVYNDLLIVGGEEPETLPCAPGDIRAYDVRTGKLRWIFHTIPHPGEFGYNTWPPNAWKYAGAANCWGGFALDAKRGILYVPTGSVSPDFYKVNEHGNLLFSDCLIALNAETGKMIWYFQAVRHDLWDRDFPTTPALAVVNHDGQEIPAVAQTSKQGFVYLFNRLSGQSLFPIKYRKYPSSVVPGELAAAEQALPTEPAPFARQLLTESMLTNRTPQTHTWAVKQFRKFISDGQFVPFRAGKPTVIFPGFDGGSEWGGPAVDPETGVLYVNANDVPWTGELAKNTSVEGTARGLYMGRCAPCHGIKMAGSPPAYPSLIGIKNRLSLTEISQIIQRGAKRMPSFSDLTQEQVSALVRYLANGKNGRVESYSPAVRAATKYYLTGYIRFRDPQGYPAVVPPWGTLSAIDLNTGKYLWKVPLGYYPELAKEGMKNTGTENYGGPVVTAGGLLFIGATCFDKKFRAFDKRTGKLLWEATLPFAGNDTPATYEVNGRQYVVIGAGGGATAAGRSAPSGGVYVAFALPR